ncbi:tudor domain-containing protein 7A-like [Oncorhynchus keta]|uniref:tudor domain-containing protein 7A-like n=1 Tax=Oncorhynchus keta TaxID=8018 RepID=UPI00227B9A7D|nr:tudor domain-containing protein 7A-like [Oncorhynchus keta]XP_052320626.1 tudor domain-containing protein 7A-like [Oncorhynchus keta]XP_052320627.1 tudor domain-containing protein 7A-like [Oncorhynchus keta]XP_052320628.1 tudor domain-containing protein 7A-like [Oncorhynchus keta]
MSDDLMKKMLRAVLQANKNGVSITRLQGEYRSLTGEFIPDRKLGYPSLECFLRSIPSVVRMENRMGEIMCFAAVCQETAHIAQLVARQKSSKRAPGRSQMLNCRMRSKLASNFVFYEKPRTSLRQPDRAPVRSGWSQPYSSMGPSRPRSYNICGGFSAGGDIRKMYSQHDERANPPAPAPQSQNREPITQVKPSERLVKQVNHHISNTTQKAPALSSFPALSITISNVPRPTPKALQPGDYNPQVVQNRISEVLKKYCSGLWLSKLPSVYRDMHKQDLPGQAVIDMENWTHICLVEKPVSTNRADRLVYPPQSKPPSLALSPVKPPTAPYTVKPANPVKLAPLFFSLRNPSLNQSQTLPTPPAPSWKHSLTHTSTSPTAPSTLWNPSPSHLLPTPTCNLWRPSPTSTSPSWKRTTTPTSPTSPSLTPTSPTPPFLTSPTRMASPTPTTPIPLSPTAVSIPAEACLRLKELLSKYSHGLWAHALPKLYQETFKVPFPEDILSNLSLLLDICTVEYPMADNKMKAILYGPTTEYKAKVSSTPSSPSGYKLNSTPMVPPLLLPKEEFPSVLVVEARSTDQVILRYIGEGYSQALETMEESMSTVYSQLSAQRLLPFPSAGELAAVKVEGGEEVVRAQVCEVMTDKVKVYYVDHGFSEVLSRTKLLELQKDFLKLPFQATTCTLAGLEQFSSELSVLQTLESLAVGKILLVELLQHDADPPQVVLYDTSHDDEVNINVVCLKALQDKAMENPLQVNSTYMNVSVTNVCSDGTIFCQLPSRGRVKLNEILDKIEAFFITQVTSESLVSTPFCGKCCLARYKGRWSRVEITNLHGSRVLDIKFVDLGVPASVEVIELREIPPSFLHELMVIPPQAIKCCLVELEVGVWTPEAVLWLRGAVLNSMDCSMKISTLDDDKLVHIYLFTSKGSQDVTNSVNHQMATSDLWKQPGPQKDGLPTLSFLDTVVANMVDPLTLDSPACSLIPVSTNTPSPLDGAGDMSNPTLVTSAWGQKQLVLPPLLELPQAGQNMDVYVSVACHPGHFVLQPWQDLYKLVVLMGEMVLYYNQREETPGPGDVQKGEVYAAKVDHNWHRVLVNRVLSSGLVSVYELDYGKHELVSCTLLQPLIESFRQLPFQGITAQLAGMEQCVWSEAASIVFRNHVEKKPLVAQVECVVEAELPWDRKMIVYLVDTSREETDIWVHNIMADFPEEQSTAA